MDSAEHPVMRKQSVILHRLYLSFHQERQKVEKLQKFTGELDDIVYLF